MKFSICLYAPAKSRRSWYGACGNLEPDCQSFEIPIGDGNLRDFLERRRALGWM
jgi:hypothetical protein